MFLYTEQRRGSEIREKVSQINVAIFRNGKWGRDRNSGGKVGPNSGGRGLA